MNLADDDLVELIRQLDPTNNEQPPEPGSTVTVRS
jgi:hypothetical protein